MGDKLFLKVAKEAANKAGRVLLAEFREQHVVTSKGDIGSIVSEMDAKVEKMILNLIGKRFPEHNILLEEEGLVDKGSDFCWVVDGLDGTIPYTNGLPWWGVTIACLKKRKPFLGVIYLPAFEEMFEVVKGKGVFLNGKSIKVSRVKNLNEAVVGAEVGYRERRKEMKRVGVGLVDEVRYVLYTGCAALGLAYVACGRLAAYIHPYATYWEPAAGVPIVEEAGGVGTDLKGKPIDWQQERLPVMVSNGEIHNKLVKKLKND